MRPIITAIGMMFIACAMGYQAFRIDNERKLLQIEVERLSAQVYHNKIQIDLLESQAMHWQQAFELVQKVHGARQN